MPHQIYLMKRQLRSTHKNGRPKYRYTLRWVDPVTGQDRYESTKTADRTQAEELRKKKWAELNRLIEPEPEDREGPPWEDCREALERAMTADNMRPRYINDALMVFDQFRAEFPHVASPANVTADQANEFKRRRAEAGKSPWTIRGDLSTLRAVFGKWLGRECGLLKENPFADVRPPRCDDPDVRIVREDERQALFAWLSQRWNSWKLPIVYLRVAELLGWRATEIASIREEDLLGDGYVRVIAATSKTRRVKTGRLPAELYDELLGCSADGWAFGRFPSDLRRLLTIWKKRPHHAARIKDFGPKRLVGWMQDELQRFCDAYEGEPFTLHDFKRTAITRMQMAGISEKETSVLVGTSPEVIRRHYERLNQRVIADRIHERMAATEAPVTVPFEAR